MTSSRSPTRRRILILSEEDIEILEDALAAYITQCQKSALGSAAGKIWKNRRSQAVKLLRKVSRNAS